MIGPDDVFTPKTVLMILQDSQRTPVPVSRHALLAVIDDIRNAVEAGDCHEGSMTFGRGKTPAEFVLSANYEIADGEGGTTMRVVGVAKGPKDQ